MSKTNPGLLNLCPNGSLTSATREALNTAWASFSDMKDKSDRELTRASSHHREVWTYLVDEYGKSCSVDEAYNRYRNRNGSKSMSRSLFGRYAETVPEGTANWIWTIMTPYNDTDVQSHTDWLRASDDTPSPWAQNIGRYVSELSPAEQRAVESFYNGEDVTSAGHPQRMSFSRAKAKLRNKMGNYEDYRAPTDVDGIPYDLLDMVGLGTRRKTQKLSHSIEGNGGRATATSANKIRLPKA